MPKPVAKILNLLSTRIVEKYKPVIIGVFDDGADGAVSLMIKEVLEKRYDVRLSCKISDLDTEIPLAVIGTNCEVLSGNAKSGSANALARGIGIAFKKADSYPNIIVLRIDAHDAGDMKKMLEIVRPDTFVFAAGETGVQSEAQTKKSKRKAREKTLLFRSLRKNDCAIFSADDEDLKEPADKSRCLKMTFGFNESAEVKGKKFQGEEGEELPGDKKGTSFKITYQGTIVPFHFSSEAGERQIYAALAAAATGLHLGSNLVEISEALRR
ncbi:MAG: Mur ligase family protein [Patescibacteria group bacterium]